MIDFLILKGFFFFFFSLLSCQYCCYYNMEIYELKENNRIGMDYSVVERERKTYAKFHSNQTHIKPSFDFANASYKERCSFLNDKTYGNGLIFDICMFFWVKSLEGLLRGYKSYQIAICGRKLRGRLVLFLLFLCFCFKNLFFRNMFFFGKK